MSTLHSSDLTNINFFESFLVSKGNVDLKEFYNFLFREFFMDFHLKGFERQSNGFQFRQQFRDRKFELTANIKAADTSSYPNRDDRNIFYRLLYETGGHMNKRKIKNNFTFYLHKEALPIMKQWLERVAATTGHIEATFSENNSDIIVQRLENLRIIDYYEINENNKDNLAQISIVFAEWIRHGFNEGFLELDTYALLTKSISISPDQIVAQLNVSSV